MANEMKRNYDQCIEAWNTGKVELFKDIFTENCVYHMAPFPDMDIEALGQFIGGFRAAFSDFRVDTVEEIYQKSISSHLWTWQGTFDNESPVIPGKPNGEKTGGPGCSFIKWEGDKMVEIWHCGDWLGALQQMGIIPTLG